MCKVVTEQFKSRIQLKDFRKEMYENLKYRELSLEYKGGIYKLKYMILD